MRSRRAQPVKNKNITVIKKKLMIGITKTPINFWKFFVLPINENKLVALV